jgi:hypothetical protein
VEKDFKLMPGCTVDLMEGANVTVAEGKTLVLYDEFNDIDNTSTTEYPSYRPAATLTIHGGATLTVGTEAEIAGRIVVASDATKAKYAKVSLASDTVTTVTSYEANGYKNSNPDYTIPLTFTAQLWNANGTRSSLTPTAGKTYYGTSAGWSTICPVELPGDLNRNNIVDFDDLSTLLTNYNKSATPENGDLNDNGTVDFDDLSTLLTNYNKTQS